jgi:chromosome partitioning protein
MTVKVITIAQQKGGAGKTTVAAQLAVAAAGLGRRVALVDIDPQGSLSRWFALRKEHGHPGVTVNAVTGWRVTAEIDRLARHHDLIIVDSPPHAETEAKIAIRAGHLVLVPIQPSPLDLWATRPTLDIAKAEKRSVLLVLNRLSGRSPIAVEMVAAAAELGVELARAKLGNRGSFAASMAVGQGVTEFAADTIGAREALKLAREVLARL